MQGLLRSGVCIIKLITAVIYGFRNKLVFVLGKPFQPSLVFRDKHSSLLQKTVNYGCNKFYDTGPWRNKSNKIHFNYQIQTLKASTGFHQKTINKIEPWTCTNFIQWWIRCHDTQHNDIQHNDIRHNDTQYDDIQQNNK